MVVEQGLAVEPHTWTGKDWSLAGLELWAGKVGKLVVVDTKALE